MLSSLSTNRVFVALWQKARKRKEKKVEKILLIASFFWFFRFSRCTNFFNRPISLCLWSYLAISSCTYDQITIPIGCKSFYLKNFSLFSVQPELEVSYLIFAWQSFCRIAFKTGLLYRSGSESHNMRQLIIASCKMQVKNRLWDGFVGTFIAFSKSFRKRSATFLSMETLLCRNTRLYGKIDRK